MSPVTLQRAVTRPRNGSSSAMDDMSPMMVMMLTRMDDGEVKRLSLFGRVRRGGRASDTGIVVFLDDLIKIRYWGGG